jgi:nucleoid DNA-binding protein
MGGKQGIIDAVAKATGMGRRAATEAVNATITAIKTIAETERVVIAKFGTFKTINRKSRHFRTPTGEECQSRACRVLCFAGRKR